MTCLLLLTAGLLATAPAPAQKRGAAADPAPVRPTSFPDVPRSHWAFDAVEQMRQRGILRGYPPGRKQTAPRRSAAKRRSAARQLSR
jgi:hypothetical protein